MIPDFELVESWENFRLAQLPEQFLARDKTFSGVRISDYG